MCEVISYLKLDEFISNHDCNQMIKFKLSQVSKVIPYLKLGEYISNEGCIQMIKFKLYQVCEVIPLARIERRVQLDF